MLALRGGQRGACAMRGIGKHAGGHASLAAASCQGPYFAYQRHVRAKDLLSFSSSHPLQD